MNSVLLRSRVGLLLGALFVIGTEAWALQPPGPGELESAAQRGELEGRLERARALGNHRTDPGLVWKFKQSQMRAAGLSEADIAAKIGNAPPPAWRGGLPATGSPKIFVLLVDFPDYARASGQTRADIQDKFFADGDAARTPYESLRNYYQRASYNALTIQGTVFDWYRAQYPRSYYEGLGFGPGQETLMKEALNRQDLLGHDFSQYDNDGDGTIDAFFIKWAGPHNGWANFWWAYQWEWHVDTSYRLDGKRLGKYVWSWVAQPTSDAYQPHVDIHETGHLLGLPDLYDYNGDQGPDGGVGDLDMMDGNWGDHNCFSKYMLGWLAPTVVGSGTLTKALEPSGTSKDCVLIMPGATQSTLFGEFFMAQYRKRTAGNDIGYPTDGMVIWHVDSTLTGDGQDFLYDNSYAAHKYVRLMEADGLEEIEQGMVADAGDFYLPPKTFGTTTTPNSRRYNNQLTGVTVDGLGTPGDTMSGTFKLLTGPDIALTGSALTQESCSIGNGAIDPHETVSMRIDLRNFGLSATTSLTATLLESGGVIAPSGPQVYGVLSPNGAAVGKPFTFTTEGTCGGTVTLSLRLQDGAADLGIVTLTQRLGAPVTALTESFDAVTAPALPTGWTALVATGAATVWKTRTGSADTTPNSAFAAGPGTIADNLLTSPPVMITTNSARLKFRHKYNIEASYDGGVLEVAVGQGPFLDLLLIGGEFESGGYTRTVSSEYGNPLAGRQAWSGVLSSYTTVVAQLPDLAGQSVRFRWRLGTDSEVSSVGWYVDSIVLEDGFACCDPFAVVAEPYSIVVNEGSTATFRVKLATPPQVDTTVTVSRQAGGDEDLTVVQGDTLVFNASNYDVFQTVTIGAAEDPDAADGQALFVCAAPDWHEAVVTAREDDANGYELRVTPSTVYIPEGGSAALQVKLGAAPLSDLQVTVGWLSGDPDITVQAGATLLFTAENWNVYQTATLSAAEDADAVDSQAIVRCSAPGWPSKTINAVEDDNDVLAIETSPSTLSLNEGQTGTFQVRLAAAPVNPLTVSVLKTSGDADIKIKSGSALRFGAGNYNVWQTVVVFAADDADAADGTATFRCSGIGMESKSVEVTEIDDDEMEIVLGAPSVSVQEGQTAGFPVKLGAQPLENVEVQVTISGDPDLTIFAGQTLTFTPASWNVYKTVTLLAAQDDDINTGEAIIRCNAPGMAEKTLPAYEKDDDALKIVPSARAIEVAEMGTAQFTVTLAAKPNSPVTVTVQLQAGDPDITLTSAGTLLFTPDTWNVPQPVTVAAARDLDTANGTSSILLSGPGLALENVEITEIDDGIEPPVWFMDADGDNAGDAESSLVAWQQPNGYVADSSDCDDANAAIHPGASEVCDNGVDDNCDGRTDEDCFVPPADNDGDGVADDLDQCPGTPAGTTVGADGCPPPPVDNDADDDGVVDSADACPGTPVGTTVQADGCPVPDPVDTDTDGDGVLDDADACPGTPAGATVDASGCTIQDNPDPGGDDDPAGQPTPDTQQDDDTPPVVPACGFGLAESLIGLLLCTCLIARRRG